jgi:hypothetical protein
VAFTGWVPYKTTLTIAAVQVTDNDVLPTFEAAGAKVEVVLSDNGREFCGRPDQHPYALFLQLEGIEHRTTRVKRPQSNGIHPLIGYKRLDNLYLEACAPKDPVGQLVPL